MSDLHKGRTDAETMLAYLDSKGIPSNNELREESIVLLKLIIADQDAYNAVVGKSEIVSPIHWTSLELARVFLRRGNAKANGNG